MSPLSRAAARALASFAAFAVAPAIAITPSLTYSPAPDSAPVVPEVTCATVVSATPEAEIDFGGAGCQAGQTCTRTIAVTASGGTPGDIGFLNRCSVARLSGDGVIPPPDVNLLFAGGQTTNEQVVLTCTPGSEATRARLCCSDSGGGLKTAPWWDVACPAGGTPDFASTPPPGQPLSINATTTQPGQVVLTVSNAGTGRLTVVPNVGDVLTVTPAAPPPLAPGQSQPFVVQCQSGVATTIDATLAFATNDPDGDPIGFPVRCVVAAPVPELTISPLDGSTLTLSSVFPQDAQATFSIANPGSGTLNVTSIGGMNGALSVDASAATIAPGGSRTFTVTCDGTRPGPHGGLLRVLSDAPARPEVSLNVACSIAGVALDAAPPPPTTLEIATTRATGSVAERSVQLANGGSGTLTVDAVLAAPSGSPLGVSPASLAIDGGGSGTLTARCARDAVGVFDGTLQLTTNDPDDGYLQYPVRCSVSAAGAPELFSDPDRSVTVAIATGINVPGTAHVRIGNAGSQSLQIGTLAEGAPGGAITVAAGVALPATVAPGGAPVDFAVTCQRGTAGTVTDTFTVTSNDADEGSVTFTVACTITQAAPAPELTAAPVAPGPLTISAYYSGETSVTLSNGGNADLVVESATGFSPPVAVLPQSATIAPGAAQTFVVSCASPRATGTFEQTLTFATNDADARAVAFQVSCTLLQPPPEFGSTPEAGATLHLAAPAALDATTAGVVNLYNYAPRGARTLTVVAGGLGAPLSVTPTSAVDVVAFQTTPVPLTVRCNPRAVGRTAQALVLDTNAPNVDPARYSVVCEGTPGPDADTTPRPGPAVLSLQTVQGQRVRDAIRVANTGQSTLRVTGVSGLSGDLGVDVPGGELPVTLFVGQAVELGVYCTGEHVGNLQQTLRLATNDVDEAQLQFGIQCRTRPVDLIFEGDFEGGLQPAPVDDDWPGG